MPVTPHWIIAALSMFDLIAFIRQYLPANRRTDLNVGFIRVLFTPVASLLLAIETARSKFLINARATGQVLLLEELCNRAAYGSSVGNVYLLDSDGTTVDFQVVIPANTSDSVRSNLVGILDAYKQAGKRYALVDGPIYAVTGDGRLAWETGYPYLALDSIVVAIQQTGAYQTTLTKDGVSVYDALVNYVAGSAVGFSAPGNATYVVTIKNLNATLTREASGSILAITYQRVASAGLHALISVDKGEVEVHLVGRNGTVFSDIFQSAFVFGATVSGVNYNRKREFFNVNDGDYTLQARMKGQTAITSIDLTLSTANKPPVVITPMPDQSGKVGQYYSYSIPSNAFGDPDGYIASYLTTGLPPGITHTPGQPIKGTPTTAGTYTVRVTVTDDKGATVYDEFVLTILPADAPDPGPGDGGGAPSGTTQYVRANTNILNLVAENNGSKWRVRNTANPGIPGGRSPYFFVDGQPWQSALATEYEYEPGDQIIVYYTIAATSEVFTSVWDIKGWAMVTFGTI